MQRIWIAPTLAAAALAILAGINSFASIRVDGTEVAAAGSTVGLPQSQKNAAAVGPKLLIFTCGQGVVARGTIPGTKSASAPARPTRIGLGYQNNVEETAYTCDCRCHTDPRCDGLTDVLDVVSTVGRAFRGNDPLLDPPTCARERTDVNCSGDTDVLDVVRAVNVAFRGANPATEFCDGCAL